jgi:hypothetical protein
VTEAVLLTCIIDADEERDVAVIDIPNAFIQTRIEDEADMAIIKIRGVLVDVLLKIASDVYKDFVTTDKKALNNSSYNARMLYTVRWSPAYSTTENSAKA